MMYPRLVLAVLTSLLTGQNKERKDNAVWHSVQRSFNIEKDVDVPHHAGDGTAAFADRCSPSSP